MRNGKHNESTAEMVGKLKLVCQKSFVDFEEEVKKDNLKMLPVDGTVHELTSNVCQTKEEERRRGGMSISINLLIDRELSEETFRVQRHRGGTPPSSGQPEAFCFGRVHKYVSFTLLFPAY